MKLIQINISLDVENFLFHKKIIDDFWIENKVISESTTIEQFVNLLDMSKRIYIKDGGEKILPFVYILVNDTLYFFYVDDNNELANECIAELKDFGFDFNKLTKVSNKDILNGVLNNKSYFCINGDYLYYERN